MASKWVRFWTPKPGDAWRVFFERLFEICQPSIRQFCEQFLLQYCEVRHFVYNFTNASHATFRHPFAIRNASHALHEQERPRHLRGSPRQTKTPRKEPWRLQRQPQTISRESKTMPRWPSWSLLGLSWVLLGVFGPLLWPPRTF